jgi:N-acetyl-beta-hexosaminidase
MVETQQHQEPIRHALEAADQAILIAQNAEHNLQAAITKADPHAIQSAQAAIIEAQKQVAEAQGQLLSFNDEHYGQQIKQTLQQLEQSSQDLEANQEKAQTPRQIR